LAKYYGFMNGFTTGGFEYLVRVHTWKENFIR